MEDIKEVHYLRDDQIPKTMYFRGINKRFSMKNVISGIVEIDGSSLVIYDWGICPIVSERDLKSWCFRITLLFYHKQKKERKTPWDKIHCPTVKCKRKD